MVLVALLSNNNGVCRYSYQPEKSGEFGILSYNINTGHREIEKLAERDVDQAFYRSPIYSMIRDNRDNLPTERLLMWY